MLLFHYSTIPYITAMAWKNSSMEIPYYQQLVEFPLHLNDKLPPLAFRTLYQSTRLFLYKRSIHEFKAGFMYQGATGGGGFKFCIWVK